MGEEDGEEENNVFWIRRVDMPSERKLVLQVSGRVRPLVRALHALLRDHETPFVGAKIIVNVDVLAILYLRTEVALTEDILVDVADVCDTVTPFTPFSSSIDQPHLIWIGRACEVHSFCEPVY